MSIAMRMTDEELEEWRIENRYLMAKHTAVGVAAVCDMTFGKGRLVVGSRYGVDDAYCYESPIEAMLALHEWDGEHGEPQGWFRHVQSGRRRPDGDPTREYVRE